MLPRWANEGRPLFNGSEMVQPAKVHPYSKMWANLLDKDKRADL
jgi:hypothetical protein